MSKLVGKVKGRGYFNGVKTKIASVYIPAHQRIETPTTGLNYSTAWNSKHETKLIFKRNLSDVDSKFIFNNKEEFQHTIDNLEIIDENSYPNRTNTIVIECDLTPLTKIELLPYNQDVCEKRVINHCKNEYVSKKVLNLVVDPDRKSLKTCAHCGTNIYPDEKRMAIDSVAICIHCLEGLGLEITAEYKKTPAKYKDDYLLARAMDI